jgi:hypothetical protein
MKLEKNKRSKPKWRQEKIYNFQKISSLLADYGYNCTRLPNEWGEADFLAYNTKENKKLKIQLKTKLTICKEYLGEDFFITFPCNNDWYLINHDKLVDVVGKITTYLNTNSWKKGKRFYDTLKPSKKLLKEIEFAKL